MQKEFLTVGELARLMGTTVRTLQYYDREGILKPSSFSEGGRRLYSAKDVVKLHQILSFKYLGFSLEEIKSRLFTLDSPRQVAQALQHQEHAIEKQMEKLREALQAIRSLHAEVLAIREVDFTKYAEIIELLRAGNTGYWVWKHFDRTLKDHIQSRFGENAEAGLKIYETYQEILEEAISLKRQDEPPEGDRGMRLAEKWWNMILDFTGGDMSLLPKLEAFHEDKENWNHPLAEKQQEADPYLNAVLNHYFKNLDGKEKHDNRDILQAGNNPG